MSRTRTTKVSEQILDVEALAKQRLMLDGIELCKGESEYLVWIVRYRRNLERMLNEQGARIRQTQSSTPFSKRI